jgi:hypothetical protein
MRQMMHAGRLPITGDHQGAAVIGLQILDQRRHELVRTAGRQRVTGDTADAELRGNRARDRFDVAGAHRQAMIRLRAEDRDAALDRVEPVHRLGAVDETAAIDDVLGVAQAAGCVLEQLRVERQDDVGVGEVVAGLDILAERRMGAGAGAVARNRIEHDPLGRRQRLHQLVDLPGQGRRGDGFRQQPEAGAAGELLGVDRAGQRRGDIGPGLDFAAVFDRLRAIRIVERENRRLRVDVRAALDRRMLRIRFDLRRPAFMTLGQHRRREAAVRHGRREIERLARHDLFGLLDVRNDQLFGLARTGRGAGEGDRRAHQLQELPPSGRIGEFRRMRRELAMQELGELGRFRQFFEAAPIGGPLLRRKACPDGRQIKFAAHVRGIVRCCRSPGISDGRSSRTSSSESCIPTPGGGQFRAGRPPARTPSASRIHAAARTAPDSDGS